MSESEKRYTPEDLFHENDLTPEQIHNALGRVFGEEYYRRISSPLPIIPGDTTPNWPLYEVEETRKMEPALYRSFMQGAQSGFQNLAAADLMQQGLPQSLAESKARKVAKSFRAFVSTLWENNLGVGREPRGQEAEYVFPPHASEDRNTLQS